MEYVDWKHRLRLFASPFLGPCVYWFLEYSFVGEGTEAWGGLAR